MRNRFCGLALIGAVLLAGCFGKKNRPPQTPAEAGAPGQYQKLIVTADPALNGKIARMNLDLQFAVINFPLRRMPSIGQRLIVYRSGLKVGELKVSGPQDNDNIIADLVAGEAATGDEVRDR